MIFSPYFSKFRTVLSFFGIAISPYYLSSFRFPLFGLGTAPFPSSSPWNSPGACHFSVTSLVGQHVLFLGFNPNVKWINAIVCRFTLHVWLVDTKNNHPPLEIYNFGLRCGSHQRNRTSAQAVRRSVAGTGAWHMSLRENVLPNNLIGSKVDHIFFPYVSQLFECHILEYPPLKMWNNHEQPILILV